MSDTAIYFEQLNVWQDAIDLAVKVYKITRAFPEDERFGLISQLKRSSSAVPANIAEGFGRHTVKDKLQFYAVAYGSLLETKSHLYLASKLGYTKITDRDSVMEELVLVQKELSAFIRETRRYA